MANKYALKIDTVVLFNKKKLWFGPFRLNQATTEIVSPLSSTSFKLIFELETGFGKKQRNHLNFE